jgi:hypothetical protein
VFWACGRPGAPTRFPTETGPGRVAAGMRDHGNARGPRRPLPLPCPWLPARWPCPQTRPLGSGRLCGRDCVGCPNQCVFRFSAHGSYCARHARLPRAGDTLEQQILLPATRRRQEVRPKEFAQLLSAVFFNRLERVVVVHAALQQCPLSPPPGPPRFPHCH